MCLFFAVRAYARSVYALSARVPYGKRDMFARAHAAGALPRLSPPAFAQ